MPSSSSTFVTDHERITLRRRREAGLSLVEVMVMLSVLSIIVGSMAPVVSESIATARLVRARNDVTQIATALVNFERDLGTPVAPTSGAGIGDQAVRVPLLVGRGEAPLTLAAGAERWVEAAADQLDEHLRLNGRRYPYDVSGVGIGWRGPYLSTEVDADPWRTRYMVNAACLVPAARRGQSIDCAVFVLSAGPDRTVDTPFEQPVTRAEVVGDDIAVRIK